MPLFVLMLMLVASAPAKAPLTEAEQIERNREEMRALKNERGGDADEHFRERLRSL